MLDINDKILCSSCFAEQTTNSDICDDCGFDNSAVAEITGALPMGTILLGKYITGKVLGRGGFGITYLAFDTDNDKRVAIKEYFPNSLSYRVPGTVTISSYTGDKQAYYESGEEKFYNEAKLISRFNGNTNIINISEFFHENNTAYYVMEYIDGVDLKKYITMNGGRLPYNEVMRILHQTVYALIIVHSMDILHRDISPDNIYITKSNDIKILDFGAARQVLGEQSNSLSVILKQGFTPLEQYKKRGNHGPWSDIYSLGATMYYALTGVIPEESINRVDEDTLRPPSMLGAAVPQAFDFIIMKMLSLKPENRYQSVIELKEALQGLQNMGVSGAGRRSGSPINQSVQYNLQNQPKPPKQTNTKLVVILSILGTVIALFVILFIIGTMSDNPEENIIDATRTPYEFRQNSSETPRTPDNGEIQPSQDIDQLTGSQQPLPSGSQQPPPSGNQQPPSSGSQQPPPSGSQQPPPSGNQQPPTDNMGGRPTQVPGPPTSEPQPPDSATTVTDQQFVYRTASETVNATYSGGWQNGMPNGQGSLTYLEETESWSAGTVITGNFVNGLLQGSGYYNSPDGTLDANFVDGIINGYGVLNASDGSYYEGTFKDGEFNGQGYLRSTEGHTYNGNFKNSLPDGYGYFEMGDGSGTYDGNFSAGEFNGYGTFITPDLRYEGDFKNNEPNGYGISYDSDGNVTFDGYWTNGEPDY